jgi:ATP-dependent Clp protease ATP-binding subunit ClpA
MSHSFLAKRCEEIELEEMENGDLHQLLKRRYSVDLTDNTIKKILSYTKVLNGKSEPLKTLEFVEDCYAKKRLDNSFIGTSIEQEIVGEILKNTGQTEAKSTWEEYRELLKGKIVGQDHLLDQIAKDIFCIKTGVQDGNKPGMAYVFAGPTGVGKTELAKQIASALYGNSHHFKRIDMAKYKKDSVAQLIGFPFGSTEHDKGGELTNALEKGVQVILFDEIEKTDPEVLKLLLAFLDEGVITSAKGKTYHFRGSIICTINLGVKDIVEDLISTKLGHEWVARVDVKKFKPIQKESAERVVQVHLKNFGSEFSEKFGVQLRWTPALVAFLVENGFDQQYGVRPLLKEINKIRPAIGMALTSLEKGYSGPLYCSIQENHEIMVSKDDIID